VCNNLTDQGAQLAPVESSGRGGLGLYTQDRGEVSLREEVAGKRGSFCKRRGGRNTHL
jgi:hypothetical protein